MLWFTESKESVEITDLGKNKKRVGIHTDITFEITAEGGDDHTNKTSREQDVDKGDLKVFIEFISNFDFL